MDNTTIANILEEIAVLMELKDENQFRIRAFRNAARSVESIQEDLKVIAERNELTEIPGIGKGIEEIIKELLAKGKSKQYEELKKGFPAGFFAILKIPGVGPKRAKILYDKLGVKSVEELQEACEEDKLLTLESFGEKSQINILQGIEQVKKAKGCCLISRASETADQLIAYLKSKAGKQIARISVAGSLRRFREFVHDIDILVATNKHSILHEVFTQYPEVRRVIAKGETRSSVLLKSDLQVDLRTVSEKEFPYALQYFTGSKEHNVAVRSKAKRMGYKVNEYGLFKGNRLVPCSDEKEIYRKLGFSYIPPELREGMGELEVKQLPNLIEEKDIKGTFHIHSTYSDGTATLEDMVKKAIQHGFQYIGISDHSKSAVYAHGLSEERVMKQHKEIDQLQKKYKQIRIFKGIESDILQDGSLDYKEPVLKSFDFIIASVHSRFKMNEKEMTKRILNAMENPHTTMIGHLTGRLLLAREGYRVDYNAVLEKSKKTGVVVELNANPHRLDLDWRILKELKSRELETSINPDAHDLDGYSDIRYGVGMARKGGLERKNVINTKDVKEMEQFLRKL